MSSIRQYIPTCPNCGHAEFDRIVDLDDKTDEVVVCKRCQEKTPMRVFARLAEAFNLDTVEKLVTDDKR